MAELNRKQAKALYEKTTGRGITYHGLFYLAGRFNFLKKSDDGHHYVYLEDKMLSYLERINIPNGYSTLKQLAEKYGVSYSWIYKLTAHLVPFEVVEKKGSKSVKAFSDIEVEKIMAERKGE